MNWNTVNFTQLPSPCYVINIDILKKDLNIMKENCKLLGINPLISIKGFPLALIYEEIAPYVEGLSAASLFEVFIGKHMGKELHVHAPAYKQNEIKEIVNQCDHIVLNSFSQLEHFRSALISSPKHPSIGLRVNPEFSEIKIDKYNPCLPNSRFGVTHDTLIRHNIDGIDGFHLHAMCDQDAETFVHIINILMEKFSSFFPRLSWINFGGGQRIADTDYVTISLQKTISNLISQYGLKIYIEPCENVVTECGYLVSTVLDIIENNRPTAILDTSATCHMPDVLEMPYHPDITYPANGKQGKNTYLLAGISCLAGDIIGEYSFYSPLHIGDKVIFSEMGAYTFAKENYFNGINIPAIVLCNNSNNFQIVKQFCYKDYESKYL